MGQHKLLHHLLTLVPLCYAPFPLAPALVERLREAGIEALMQQCPAQDPPEAPSICLWIYDSPDRVLLSWRQQADPPALQQLLEGLQTLLVHGQGGPLISAWRLEQLDSASLRHWLNGPPDQTSHPDLSVGAPPPIDPLAAQLVLTLLQEQPALLECYLDLELKSELAGTMPDSRYLERLQASVSSTSLLDHWWGLQAIASEHKLLHEEQASLREAGDSLASQLQSRQRGEAERQEEATLLMLQLQELQLELEHVFLRSREYEQQVVKQAQALETLNEESQAEKARSQALREEISHLASSLENCQSKNEEVKEAREESNLLMLQLQQVQQELEHYFLVSRQQGELMDRMDQQLQRALQLLVQVSPQPAVTPPR